MLRLISRSGDKALRKKGELEGESGSALFGRETHLEVLNSGEVTPIVGELIVVVVDDDGADDNESVSLFLCIIND